MVTISNIKFKKKKAKLNFKIDLLDFFIILLRIFRLNVNFRVEFIGQ